MSIAFVQGIASNFNNGTGAASESLAYAGNNTLGNLLFAIVTYRGSSVTVTLSDTGGGSGNTWIPFPIQTLNGGIASSRAFYASNCAGGANTVTANFSGSATQIGIALSEHSGVNIFDVGVQTTGAASLTPNSGPSPSTTQANELVIGWAATDPTTEELYTLGAGYSNLIQQVGSPFATCALESKIVASTGMQTSTFTQNNSAIYAAGVATFYESSSGGGLSTVLAATSTPVTVTNSTGVSQGITSPTLGTKIGQPLPIVFTDPNGNEYSVSSATAGSFIANPTPVVLCNSNGLPIVPPFVYTSNGNSITVNATTTGVKLSKPIPVTLCDNNGFLYVTAGLGFTFGSFIANPLPICLTDTNGNVLTSAGLAT